MVGKPCSQDRLLKSGIGISLAHSCNSSSCVCLWLFMSCFLYFRVDPRRRPVHLTLARLQACVFQSQSPEDQRRAIHQAGACSGQVHDQGVPGMSIVHNAPHHADYLVPDLCLQLSYTRRLMSTNTILLYLFPMCNYLIPTMSTM